MYLVHAEPLVDLPPVLVALARLAALAAVALLAAQLALLRRRHAAVVLPRVADVLKRTEKDKIRDGSTLLNSEI